MSEPRILTGVEERDGHLWEFGPLGEFIDHGPFDPDEPVKWWQLCIVAIFNPITVLVAIIVLPLVFG